MVIMERNTVSRWERGQEIGFAHLSNAPLLTREGEVELARQLEHAKLEIRRTIAESPLRLPELEKLIVDASLAGPSTDTDAVVEALSDPKLNELVALEQHYARLIAKGAARRTASGSSARAGARKGSATGRLLEKRRTLLQEVSLPDSFFEQVALRIEQTAAQFEYMNRSAALELAAQTGSGLTPKSVREINARIRKARREAERFKAEMVEANIRLVISFAKRLTNRSLPLPDLVQEGTLGLMRAVDKFDYRRGFRFSTYASWWIRQAMQRATADQSRTIRVPFHLNESMQKVARAGRALGQKLGREPTSTEIAAAAGLTPEKVQAAQEARHKVISFSAPVGDDNDRQVSDLVEDSSVVMADDDLIQDDRDTQAIRLLNTLAPREQKVIRMRFGIGQRRDYTLREIGDQMKVSRERVRQIEASALEKLKAVAEHDQVLPFDFIERKANG